MWTWRNSLSILVSPRLKLCHHRSYVTGYGHLPKKTTLVPVIYRVHAIHCEVRKCHEDEGLALVRKANYVPTILRGNGKPDIMLQIELSRFHSLESNSALEVDRKYLMLVYNKGKLIETTMAEMKDLITGRIKNEVWSMNFVRTKDRPDLETIWVKHAYRDIMPSRGQDMEHVIRMRLANYMKRKLMETQKLETFDPTSDQPEAELTDTLKLPPLPPPKEPSQVTAAPGPEAGGKKSKGKK